MVLLSGCSAPADPKTEAPGAETLFTEVSSERSGIRFTNRVDERPDQNYYVYEYMYNGGGVAIGDIDNDGLPDIYFTGNMVPDKLYRNLGGLRFEDITATAITQPDVPGWHSGVTMADVNGDGLIDIHVCRAGWSTDPNARANMLYINNGDLTFTEMAEAMGVADTTRSTQAAFFDMDGDGDLDLYVLNAPMHGGPTLSNQDVQRLLRDKATHTDRLYRNDGGRFTDVTWSSGIGNMGYGLGLSISDLNGDGLPDIYVANDYIERDFMYINQGNGTFRDDVLTRMRHISNFAMGCDVADYDNDGLVDIVVLDMVSEDHVRSKKNMGAMSSETFWKSVRAGYHHQYMFNTLQRNNGNGTFSEVGQLAGISKTDWSWAPLLADLDNDGHKDLLVTNGYKRDMRDNDYMAKARELTASGAPVAFERLISLVPATRIRNYLYRNNGDLTFSDVSMDWGFTEALNSNGAAYADLDGDGDLDLVINNIDHPASIWENSAAQQGLGRSVRVALEGAAGAKALGAKVYLHANGGIQMQEAGTTRGFQSSVEPVLHFGVGADPHVDSLVVEWPDGRVSVIASPRTDGITHVALSTAQKRPPMPVPTAWLSEVDMTGLGLAHKHEENRYDDFLVEVLLPHSLSDNGPLLSVADVNGDGLEDLFVGAARGGSGTLYLQAPNGTFRKAATQPWTAHRESEDLGSLFFDANGDGHADLCVVSGSNEVDIPYEAYGARLYLNDGTGGFSHAPDALPTMETSGMRIVAADVDGDGAMDLFIGGRVVPGMYPKAPRSYLLMNDGKGRFTDRTADLAPGLVAPGMVTGAVFLDHDGDGDPDLFLVGEWMPIMYFRNDGGRFSDQSTSLGLKDTEGWWASLTAMDLDGDGRQELVCGNIGWNTKFKATATKPLHIYWNDFDGNGRPDIVLAKDQGDVCYPVRGRECSSQQVPAILEKFPTYDAFAHASVEQIYGEHAIDEALHLQARYMRSCVLHPKPDGSMERIELPMLAQAAPIRAARTLDVDGDGRDELVVAGNMWGAEVETIRYDAGTGLVMKHDGGRNFAPMAVNVSGLFAWHDVRDLAVVHLGIMREPLIIVANNNGVLQGFRRSPSSKASAQRR